MAAYLNQNPQPFSLLYTTDIIFQIIFFISIILPFLTEFEPAPGLKVIRDPIVIANRYVKSQFIFDILPLIPFNLFVNLNYGFERLFFLIKLIRLQNGFKILNVHVVMRYIK